MALEMPWYQVKQGSGALGHWNGDEFAFAGMAQVEILSMDGRCRVICIKRRNGSLKMLVRRILIRGTSTSPTDAVFIHSMVRSLANGWVPLHMYIRYRICTFTRKKETNAGEPKQWGLSIIAWIAIGAVVGMIIVALLAYIAWMRHKKRRNGPKPGTVASMVQFGSDETSELEGNERYEAEGSVVSGLRWRRSILCGLRLIVGGGQ
jgi:hypothetical protein